LVDFLYSVKKEEHFGYDLFQECDEENEIRNIQCYGN
jgi:hypothetical protein